MGVNKIVIDAMGGDNAPLEIVTGALTACEMSSTLHCIFVGDREKILPLIGHSKVPDSCWSVVAASEVISMEDHPKEAVRDKKDASINVAARLLRDDQGDALVSAGNTGATILACSQYIPRISGIERGVLAAILPANRNHHGDPGFSIMLDVGATLHCSVNQLVSFAMMGTEYARHVMSVDDPRVGLLNIGEEETKGHEILVTTNRTLKNIPEIHFIGNIEGKDILRGIADVIVTEGLTGNIVLKTMEGMVEMTIRTGKRIWKKNLLSKLGLTMLSPILKKLKKRMDYSEYGGAPILGFQKLIIKAHGRSRAKAIKNAVLMAERSIKNNLIQRMEEYTIHLTAERKT